jgi:hypothetical protein
MTLSILPIDMTEYVGTVHNIWLPVINGTQVWFVKKQFTGTRAQLLFKPAQNAELNYYTVYEYDESTTNGTPNVGTSTVLRMLPGNYWLLNEYVDSANQPN